MALIHLDLDEKLSLLEVGSCLLKLGSKLQNIRPKIPKNIWSNISTVSSNQHQVDGWMRLNWTDEYLSWVPSQHGGIELVNFYLSSGFPAFSLFGFLPFLNEIFFLGRVETNPLWPV